MTVSTKKNAGILLLLLIASGLFCPLFSKPHAKESPTKAGNSHHRNAMLLGRTAQIQQGKKLFLANQCLDCHRLGDQGCADGISLDRIGEKRSARFLQEQLKDPEEHVRKAAKEFGGDSSMMPSPNLSENEQMAMVSYLMSLTEQTVQGGKFAKKTTNQKGHQNKK